MKILLIILVFSFVLIGSEVDKSYLSLNTQVDKLSSILTTQEKVSLYYFIMATHDKINSSLSIDNIKDATLKVFSQIKKNLQIHKNKKMN